MAVSGQQVFDMAMVLINEVSETGNLEIENPKYYETKALTHLTTMQAELLPISQVPVPVNNLSDSLALSDRVCLLVLPYGLAAHLLLTDDPNAASFYNERYEELKRKMPTKSVPIIDVYNMRSRF